MNTEGATLQEHVRKMHRSYEHARLAQEALLFSAWVNGQQELAELRALKRRKQITWALLGGPTRETLAKMLKKEA